MTKRRLAPLTALALLPFTTAFGFVVLPRWNPGDRAADGIAAAWTSLSVIASLALASRAESPLVVRAALGLAAAAGLAVIALRGDATLVSVTLVGFALVVVAHVIGDSIGRRIADPGHMAPACAVAGGADLASVLSPEGLSHAIASSDAAISLLVVAGPVPGVPGGVAPTIGVGDLVFMALLFGAAAKHGVSRLRVALAVTLGVAAALAASATLGIAIPALPAIGAAAVALVPPFRTPRPRDRKVARIAVAVGVALGVVAIGRAVLSS